ncbi:Crp/Fnr family transcriptional regulator [Lacinutrix undariae]
MKNLIKYAIKYGLSEDLIQEINLNGKQIEIKKNENILNVGEHSKYIYIVIKGGFISQYFDDNKSKFRTTSFHIDNYHPFMTQPESYFSKKPSDTQIKAFKKSQVIEFHRNTIEKLSLKHKSFDKFCNTHIIEALIFINQIKSKLIGLPKDKLYDYLLEEHGPITKNVPSKYIAEFMGVTPQWLSKIKRTS